MLEEFRRRKRLKKYNEAMNKIDKNYTGTLQEEWERTNENTDFPEIEIGKTSLDSS